MYSPRPVKRGRGVGHPVGGNRKVNRGLNNRMKERGPFRLRGADCLYAHLTAAGSQDPTHQQSGVVEHMRNRKVIKNNQTFNNNNINNI
jgi:hypothetical protein